MRIDWRHHRAVPGRALASEAILGFNLLKNSRVDERDAVLLLRAAQGMVLGLVGQVLAPYRIQAFAYLRKLRVARIPAGDVAVGI